MKKIILVKESLDFKQLNRKNRQQIDPSNVDVIYHWLTEGKFFYACYGDVSEDDKFILDRKNIMPPKPPTKYELGYRGICLTVDPTYTEPAFNEDGICLVLDMKQLLKDYELINLSDNGEAEFRTIIPIKYKIQ